MSRVTIQAAVTMGQLQRKLDLIGHNMANSSTTGYKSQQADFSSLLFQQIDNLKDPEANAQGRVTPDGVRIGSGAVIGHTNLNLKQGSIKETGRALDVALLKENHLFQVGVRENGIEEAQLTRSGEFYISPVEDGQVLLTDKNGNPVFGANGEILIEEGFDSITIANNGQVLVTRNGVEENVAQLAIVEAVYPRLLEQVGNNNFRLPLAAQEDYNVDEVFRIPDQIEVKSGALETSNVDLSHQMTELLATQRAYQLNARSISMSDQMAGLVNQLR